MEYDDLSQWIELYERAWRTPGCDLLQDLFAPSATYLAAPFDPPLRGQNEIAEFWEGERESADEVFALSWRPVAIDDDVGVAKVEVRYGDPVTSIYRDIWIITLDRAGRCTSFEEWPFFPGQPRTSGATQDG